MLVLLISIFIMIGLLTAILIEMRLIKKVLIIIAKDIRAKK
nr:hypothetical protein [uncultured Niameybacter sp.]